MKKVFIFLGPPGSGKGTQTSRLADKLSIPHIDTGSLLRKNIQDETELGKIAKSYIDKGNLVPLNVVSSVIKERLMEDDCQNGYILDGFPRSIEQARALEEILSQVGKFTLKDDAMAIYFDIDNALGLVNDIAEQRIKIPVVDLYFHPVIRYATEFYLILVAYKAFFGQNDIENFVPRLYGRIVYGYHIVQLGCRIFISALHKPRYFILHVVALYIDVFYRFLLYRILLMRLTYGFGHAFKFRIPVVLHDKTDKDIQYSETAQYIVNREQNVFKLCGVGVKH